MIENRLPAIGIRKRDVPELKLIFIIIPFFDRQLALVLLVFYFHKILEISEILGANGNIHVCANQTSQGGAEFCKSSHIPCHTADTDQPKSCLDPYIYIAGNRVNGTTAFINNRILLDAFPHSNKYIQHPFTIGSISSHNRITHPIHADILALPIIIRI